MKNPKHYDTDESTSIRMSRVKLNRGNAEVQLEKILWHRGYRYRLNYKKLKGSPDIAILKYHIAIFIDGEFWHGKDWSIRKQKIKRNKEYWIEKIEENIERDKRVDESLRYISWTPIHFWSSEVIKHLDECARYIDGIIKQK